MKQKNFGTQKTALSIIDKGAQRILWGLEIVQNTETIQIFKALSDSSIIKVRKNCSDPDFKTFELS